MFGVFGNKNPSKKGPPGWVRRLLSESPWKTFFGEDWKAAYVISDLQVPQRKLMEYERASRVVAAGVKNRFGRPPSSEELSLATDEESDRYLAESCGYVVGKYAEAVVSAAESGKYGYVVDAGDFVFNVSGEKIRKLESMGLMDPLLDAFRRVRSLWVGTVLVMGNHDSPQYGHFYRKFFDTVADAAVFFPAGGKAEIVTHWPLLSEGFESYKRVPKGCLSVWKSFSENAWLREASVNRHGHVHSRSPVPEILFHDAEYRNECIDRKILDGFRPHA